MFLFKSAHEQLTNNIYKRLRKNKERAKVVSVNLKINLHVGTCTRLNQLSLMQ